MIDLKSRLTFKQVIYVSTISIAVASILLFAVVMFSKEILFKTVEPEKNIEMSSLDSVNTELKRNVISRSSTDSRTSVETKKADTENVKKEEQSKVEVKKEEGEKSEKQTEETKKEETKTASNTTTTKNTNSNTKNVKSTSSKSDSINKTKNVSSSDKKSTQSSNKTTEVTKNTDKTENKKTTTTKSESKKSATTTTSISEVRISKTMDLTKRTGLSRDDFIKLISGVRADTSGFFEKNAGKIYDLCAKYSINEIFFCGLISAESGWNIASNHRKAHNYISLMRNGKLIKYSSVNEGLEVAAQKLHNNYLTPGGKFYRGKTLSGVKTYFCPSGGWVNLVYGRMKQIV